MIRKGLLRQAASGLALLCACSAPLAAEQVDMPSQAGWDSARRMAITSDGVHLTYLELGQEPGMEQDLPAVLVHDFGDSSRGWSLLASELRKALPMRRIIAVDLRGHGASDAPACCYGPDSLAHDVSGLIQSLGIAQVDLVGEGLGATVAVQIATARPQQVRKLVMISAMTELPQLTVEKLWLELPAHTQSLTASAPFTRDWTASTPPAPAEFLAHQQQEVAAIPPHVWLGVLTPLSAWNWHWQGSKIMAPVQILWGENDADLTGPSLTQLRGTLPLAEFHEIKDAGDKLVWTQPLAVAQTMSAFLSNNNNP